MAFPIEEGDSRVTEWLDDKLQTLADLDSLDALLQDVRGQQVLLRKQLHDANQDLHHAAKARQQHQDAVRAQADQFTKSQRDIDRRLKIITQSETSDDAVARFEGSMAKLRRLDIAAGYVQQLHDVDKLSALCLASLGNDDLAALDAYHRMYRLAASLPDLQEAAEGAAPHLVDHITDVTKQLRARIENVFSKQLDDVLRQAKWPSAGQAIPAELEAAFRNCVLKLLNLQKPELDSAVASQDATREPPLVLLPLQVMVKPMEVLFRYYFESDKPTNRIDKPEYFLNHVTDKLLGQNAEFVADALQPLLSNAFQASDIALNGAYSDANSAFVTALLPMVRNKVFSILPDAAREPHLLSHLVHELMRFDETLREEWSYDDGSKTSSWRGLTYEVLSTDDWFKQWLNIEKDFALARYEELVEAADSKDLDSDAFPIGVTKPTKAAIRVNDLLEATTDNYRTLGSFSQRLRFLIDIQIAIFDRYHERLLDHLNAFQIRNTRLGRTSKEEQLALQGPQGLETLAKIYGSAEYLEKAMRDWSDDVFFLDMWDELQHRASAQTGTVGDMSIVQAAEATSSALGTEDGALNGAMFDETAASYQRLRIRCETLITELVSNQVRTALQPYTRINPWSTLSSTATDPSSLPTTAELDPLLTTLRSTLSFLHASLGKLPLRKISRAAAHTIDDTLFNRILLTHSFSASGTTQLSADILSVRLAFAAYVDAGVAETGLRRVSEGARLVGLPIRGRKGEDGGELGLWEVEKALFESGGDVARGVLAEVGIEGLAVFEARKVLARRVELSS